MIRKRAIVLLSFWLMIIGCYNTAVPKPTVQEEEKIIRIPPNERHPIPGSYSLQSNGKNWGIDYYLGKYSHSDVRDKASRIVRVYIFDTANGSNHDLLQKAIQNIEHRDFTADLTDIDVDGHGSHVAGIVAANSPKIGIAYGLLQAEAIELKFVKILNNDGEGALSWIVKAYTEMIAEAKELIQQGRFVIFNNSWGAGVGRIPELDKIIKKAYDAGIFITAASGNFGGLVETPASIPYTQAIGAINQEQELTSWSARGQAQSFAAPGQYIYSTITGNGYAYWSGTSMATPSISALAAITASVYPGLNAYSLTEYLTKVSTDGGKPGFDELYGYGIPIVEKILNTPPSNFDLDDQPKEEPVSEDMQEHVSRQLNMPLGYIGNIVYGSSFNPNEALGVIVLKEVTISIESDRRAEYEFKNVYTACRGFTRNRGLVQSPDSDYCDAIYNAAKFLEIYLVQNNIPANIKHISGFTMVQGEGMPFTCEHADIDLKGSTAEYDDETGIFNLKEAAYGPLSQPAGKAAQALIEEATLFHNHNLKQ